MDTGDKYIAIQWVSVTMYKLARDNKTSMDIDTLIQAEMESRGETFTNLTLIDNGQVY